MKKYNLDLVAATFIILDSNEASMQVSFIDHVWKASLYRLVFFKLFLPIFGVEKKTVQLPRKKYLHWKFSR